MAKKTEMNDLATTGKDEETDYSTYAHNVAVFIKLCFCEQMYLCLVRVSQRTRRLKKALKNTNTQKLIVALWID